MTISLDLSFISLIFRRNIIKIELLSTGRPNTIVVAQHFERIVHLRSSCLISHLLISRPHTVKTFIRLNTNLPSPSLKFFKSQHEFLNNYAIFLYNVKNIAQFTRCFAVK